VYTERRSACAIEATSPEDAVDQARAELYSVDFESDGWTVKAPDDFTKEEYIVLYVFEGHIAPVAYGDDFPARKVYREYGT
jgi:hypothetical protein